MIRQHQVNNKLWSLWLFFLMAASQAATFTEVGALYVSLQDAPDPAWDNMQQNLVVGQNSWDPAYGSTVMVNQELVQQGIYSQRPIPEHICLHTLTNSHIRRPFFDRYTRWYQEDENTQVFRLFPGEDNIRNTRENAPRIEAYGLVSWERGDGWYEWSGRYTFVKVRRGAVLQIKHNSTYWSMQLVLREHPGSSDQFDLWYTKLREPSSDVLLKENVVGQGVDIMVLDNGENHRVYVDQKQMVDDIMTDRPIGERNRARWGFYSPPRPIDRDILIFVTGAYVGRAAYSIPLTAETVSRRKTGGGLRGPTTTDPSSVSKTTLEKIDSYQSTGTQNLDYEKIYTDELEEDEENKYEGF